MDSKLFVARMGRLHPLQLVNITFKVGQDSITGLRRLVVAASLNNIIEEQKLGIVAVMESHQWDQVSRTVSVYSMSSVPSELLEGVARDVERVSVGAHFAQGIFTSSQAKQQLAAATIISSVIDADNERLAREIGEWGACIDGELQEVEGLPAIVFTVSNGGTGQSMFKVTIDGWSGRTMLDGVWGDTRVSSVSGMRALISSALLAHLDKPIVSA